MQPPLLPPPPAAGKVVLLWLLTRLAGAILLAGLLALVVIPLIDDPPARPGDQEWGDALGPGVAFVLSWVWGASFDLFCSLPLLLAAGSIGQALQTPDGPARRRQLRRTVARWQALPGALVAGLLVGLLARQPVAAMGYLLVVGFYLLVAWAVARLLYGYWLHDQYFEVTD